MNPTIPTISTLSVRLGATVLAATLVAGVAGCDSTPRGESGGRVDPYRSTEADLESEKISMPSLLEATDVASERLAADIADVARDFPAKKVLELGPVDNQTDTPTSDFNLAVRRLASNLRKSPLIKEQLMFVERRGRVERDIETIGIETDAPGDAPAGYNTRDTLILYGDFMEANRGHRRYYFYEFKLVDPATREVIWDKPFDLSQR